MQYIDSQVHTMGTHSSQCLHNQYCLGGILSSILRFWGNYCYGHGRYHTVDTATTNSVTAANISIIMGEYSSNVTCGGWSRTLLKVNVNLIGSLCSTADVSFDPP